MKYIRSCENCYREIRFPIDKGTLFITCPYCHHTFKINPDDPQMYRSGRFDLNRSIPNQETQYPEEFFFNQHHKGDNSPKVDKKKLIKTTIVLTLFFLLFSHVYKIANTPDFKEHPHNPKVPTENKPQTPPNFEI
jgi:hypothetical protein